MNRLIEIANKLGELYEERIDAGIHKSHIESDLAERIFTLTPLDGWPGKNQEQREQAKELRISADDAYAEMQSIIRELEQDLGDINGEIEALEAERRALEWTIRGQLVEALSGKRNGHEDIKDAAFDDAADNQTLDVFMPEAIRALETEPTEEMPF